MITPLDDLTREVINFLSWNEVLNVRSTNTDTKNLIENHCLTYFVQGGHSILRPCSITTIINSSVCDHCYRSQSKNRIIGATTYLQDRIPRRLIVRCKDDWRCRFAAMFSRSKTSSKSRIYYCMKPMLEVGEKVKIPRTNGTVSLATVMTPEIVRWSRTSQKLFGMFGWEAPADGGSRGQSRHGREFFEKCVFLNEIERKKKKLSTGEFWAKIILLDKLSCSDLVEYILEYITKRPIVKLEFCSWGGSKCKSIWNPPPEQLCE